MVHARGIDQLVGNRQHVLAQQEYARRRGHRGPDDSPKAVQHPELGHDEEVGHEDDRRRNHQRRDDQRNTASRPPNRYFDSANAAMALKSSVISVATTVM